MKVQNTPKKDDLKWEQWLEPCEIGKADEEAWFNLWYTLHVHFGCLFFSFCIWVYSCSISGGNNCNLLQLSPSWKIHLWEHIMSCLLSSKIMSSIKKHLQNNTQQARWLQRGCRELQSQIHYPFVWVFFTFSDNCDSTEEMTVNSSLQQNSSLHSIGQ